MKPSLQDPELAMQERFNPFAWVVFHLVAAWSTASRWIRFKRVCAWHEPKARYMGGNPFARRLTHGMCPDCAAKYKAEIVSHARLKSAIENNTNLIHHHL
jgi:hypothetical protein